MECHNTNSSPCTISLDYEEGLESIDSFIVNCGEKGKPKKHHRHYKSKCEHRRRNKNHKKENTDSGRTKFVTQEIHVERQDFKCIINLNTTMCNHKNRQISCNKKLSEKSSSDNKKDRTVPRCLRQTCSKSRHHGTRHHRHSKEHCKKSTQAKRSEKEIKSNLSRQISINKQMESEYEDISTKSLDNYLEIPISYKYTVKTCKQEYRQSKLDTLIKRTKERERKLVELSRKSNPWYTSTPYTEVSSADCPNTCSENDISIASRSTLVLEPWYHSYSPSIEGFYPTKAESYYSPSSANEEFWLERPERNDEFQIKSEPRMGIEVYSPTQSPDLQNLSEAEEIIIELKTEKFTAERN